MKLSKFLEEKSSRQELPTQKEIADYLGKIYPLEQENKLFHDRWGLYSETPDKVVSKIILAATPTLHIANLMAREKYDLLISHHDFIVDVPQIIFHSIMDEGIRGHNTYFGYKLGLKNMVKKEVIVEGNLPTGPLSLEEFKKFLEKKGFAVEGLVWKREGIPEDTKIESVVYCSGLGGMLISKSSLYGMRWTNTEFDLTNHSADCYVTGELLTRPRNATSKFNYIIELGHTSSEKPIFRWVRNILKNRWQNLQIDMAPKEIDYFGQDKLGDEKKNQIFKEPATPKQNDRIHHTILTTKKPPKKKRKASNIVTKYFK